MKTFAVLLLMILFVVCHCDAGASNKELIKRVTNGGSVHYSWFQAIAKVESNFNHTVMGDKGKAYGLFQIHKSAAIEAGYLLELEASIEDAHLNVLIGLFYFYVLYNRLNKNLACTISAYNKGPNFPDINGNCRHHAYYKKVKLARERLCKSLRRKHEKDYYRREQ